MQEKRFIYVDVCMRGNLSRTRLLAESYLEKLRQNGVSEIEKIYLEDKKLSALDMDLMAWRDKCIAAKDFSNEYFDYARKVAGSDVLVIAAPYWDLGFPAQLKLFLEQICINNLAFTYQNDGTVKKLNSLKKVVYLTTSGGFIGANNWGFEYIKGLFRMIFSVNEFEFYSAEGLDVDGTDTEKALADAQKSFKL